MDETPSPDESKQSAPKPKREDETEVLPREDLDLLRRMAKIAGIQSVPPKATPEEE